MKLLEFIITRKKKRKEKKKKQQQQKKQPKQKTVRSMILCQEHNFIFKFQQLTFLTFSCFCIFAKKIILCFSFFAIKLIRLCFICAASVNYLFLPAYSGSFHLLFKGTEKKTKKKKPLQTNFLVYCFIKFVITLLNIYYLTFNNRE